MTPDRFYFILFVGRHANLRLELGVPEPRASIAQMPAVVLGLCVCR
jgi:hypothetical protein